MKSAIVPLWTDVDGPARLRARTLDSLILMFDCADEFKLPTPLRRERPGAFEFLAAVAVVRHLIINRFEKKTKNNKKKRGKLH